jgi:uncharacterized protein YcbK (DUF882 family)
MNRREFLLATGAVAGSLLLPAVGHAADWDSLWLQPRKLELVRSETGETVSASFWTDGKLDRAGYAKICHVLRDVQDNQAVQMDLELLNLLYSAQGWLQLHGFNAQLIINSGFRTFRTNKRLQEAGIPAATRSYHLYGKAVDFRMAGVPQDYASKLLGWFKQGGVGVYTSRHGKGFIHADTGPRRTWAKKL